MRGKAYARVLLVLAAFGYMFWTHRARPWTPMRISGAILAAIGLIFWTAALLQLGPSFAVQARAKALVSGGIYSKIRNPIYAFSTMTIAGLVFFVERPRWLLLLAVLIPLQIWRAGVEARVLEEKFGDACREYRGKTWF
jgi:protein-S-isoprenylcysteine O-methyltransferase Ste14